MARSYSPKRMAELVNEANRRLRMVELYAREITEERTRGYRKRVSPAYGKAQNILKQYFGPHKQRFSVITETAKEGNTVRGYYSALERFLRMETSTPAGIQRVAERRSESIDKALEKFALRGLTDEEKKAFFETMKRAQQIAPAKTESEVALAIAVMIENKIPNDSIDGVLANISPTQVRNIIALGDRPRQLKGYISRIHKKRP